MTRWRPSSCKDCFTTEPPLSTRGLCQPCALKRQAKAAREMANKEGRHYEAWLAKMRELTG